MSPARCFYCLADRVHIGVCVDCRTRLERAESELKRLKKDLEITRAGYFRLVGEKAGKKRKR
jgi:hypothetical protein